MATRNFHWSSVFDCVMHETDGAAATIATYTHEPEQFGPLLSENRSGTEFIHHYDALGSTNVLTNDSGTVVDTFYFDAWGNSVARTGTTPTPYRWVGRWSYQFDTSTSVYYVRARSYQPLVARWSSVDPLRFFDGVNDYLYSRVRPVDHYDASGNKCTANIKAPPRLLPYDDVAVHCAQRKEPQENVPAVGDELQKPGLQMDAVRY